MTFYYGMDLSDTSYNIKVLVQMIAFFIVYLAFYKILRKNKPDERPEYCCRIVTFIHGLFSCFFAIYYIVLPSLGYVKGESHAHITPRLNAKAFMLRSKV